VATLGAANHGRPSSSKTTNNPATGNLQTDIVDDFETRLCPTGVDGDGNGIGFVTWGDFMGRHDRRHHHHLGGR
jgi:hypothetical protein